MQSNKFLWTFLFSFLLIQAAQAADQGVKLGIGGIYKAGFGAIVDEDDGVSQPQAQFARDDAIKQFVKLAIEGETKLANGMTVGALVELFGQTVPGGQVDDTIMFVEGNFGRVTVGDTDDARMILAVVGPEASNVFAADQLTYEGLSFSNNPLTTLTSYANNVGGLNTTLQNVEAASTKLIYTSPAFNGFAFAVSYAPDASSDTQNGTGGTPSEINGGNSEAWSVAGAYDGKFQNVGVKASLGYTDSSNETAGLDDVSSWQTGLNLSMGRGQSADLMAI